MAVTTAFLAGRAPALAVTITVDFENLPSLAAQPNNFAAAGPMQTYTVPGVFSITGGVVLGNPSFLTAFPTHGSPPNLYGTADFGDPSLRDAIELDLPAAAETTSVSLVLFNGQPIGEAYEVDFFSGVTLICAEPFANVPANSSSGGFTAPSCSSTLALPITKVTITTPNAGLNGWDFFVDTIVLTQNPVTPVAEPSSLLLVASGAAVVGYVDTRRRKRYRSSSVQVRQEGEACR
jgi:hypothetical protein